MGGEGPFNRGDVGHSCPCLRVGGEADDAKVDDHGGGICGKGDLTRRWKFRQEIKPRINRQWLRFNDMERSKVVYTQYDRTFNAVKTASGVRS